MKGIVSLLIASFIFQILPLAGLSMLACNFVLPAFDVNYPITFLHGCGIGVLYVGLRAVFLTEITVNNK